MKFSTNKTRATLIALFLTLTIAVPLAALPATNAQGQGELTSYAYMDAAPNPVGVGQRTYISMWVDASLPESLYTNDIRRHGYTLTIKDSDGNVVDTEEWAVVEDTTGVAFTSFTPDEAGTYTLLFEYDGQEYTWNSTSRERQWTGTVFLPASKTVSLVVQEEPIPDPIYSYPLPTEYWTRPIDGQNLDWYTISSHWLRGEYFGSFALPGGRLNLWQRDGTGPNTGHIMWTMPVEFGGVVGGTNVRVNGSTYYSGGSYEGRFGDAIIMQGRLYFTMPLGHSGGGGDYVCVDLRTGEVIWSRDDLGSAGGYSDSKGELYDFDSQNQHGVGGGILWQVESRGGAGNWFAYDGFTGKWMYNITDVPRGSEVYTNRGEIVRYVLNYNDGWMALWNWTEALDTRQGGAGYATGSWRPNGKSINTSDAYSWNVTNLPDLSGASSPSIVYILPGDLIIGRSSSITTGTYQMSSRVMDDPWTVWAISDRDDGTRGNLLWKKDYPAPDNTIGLTFGPLDPVNRVWTMAEAETMQWLGFSVDTGNELWGPTDTEIRDMQYFSSGSGAGQRAVTAYGNIYVQGYGGELFCYDTEDGTLLWKYNNTYSGLSSPWGLNPILLATVADGKVYAFNNEHSPNAPLYRGYKVYCVNATTGEEVWAMDGWAGTIGGHGVSTCVLADGFFAYYNFYDNSVYSVGKGPSATTVTAAPKVSVHGDNVLVEGTVMDIAAGTQQDEQAARFPYGVPAVSDESMSAWMEYVYMQKPRPSNATGVGVTLSVLDPNNNYYEIGTVTSDSNGMYKLLWEPLVPGEYTVIATFAGSESYWPSHAETAVGVTEAPEATPPPTEPPAPATDMYVLGSTVGIIIAIVVVGLVLVLMLRKR